MQISTPVLANPYVEVRFSVETGNPVHLSEPGGSTLLTDCFCRYVADGGLITEKSDGEGEERFEVVSVTPSQNAVESVVRAPGLKIVRRFELAPESPLLKVTHTAEGTGELEEIHHPAFPRVCFTEGFTDAFEDEEDLFFDGAELGGGRELPCWRVFFRAGHREGLIVATRSKYDMSHFQIYERSFDILPHLMTAYDSGIPLAPRPMSVGPAQSYTATFEIGPWTAGRHDTLLKAAGLDRPHRVPPRDAGVPEVTEAPPEDLPGILFDILEVADPSVVSQEYATDRWMVAHHPVYRGGKALIAGPGVTPPPITLDPKLNGVYRIFAGIGNGNGFAGRLSGDDMPTFRIPHTVPHATPFYLRLSGPQKGQEILIRTTEMDGRTLRLEPFPDPSATTVFDYVRFEALTPEDQAEWRAEEAREPSIELSGFNDIPDIKKFTDLHDPDPVAYAANLWEHAGAGVKKVFWRIDGQCSDYPSKVNTMRYTSARVHGIFHPQSKAYGRVLKKTDMLALAVKAARDYGLTLYGWMRFNNYSGNVQSGFYRDHPELREEFEDGSPAPKLCLAHEAVRRHKIDILVEAARYGLDGLVLGFLRHPPVSLYAPVLVAGYRERYGVPPPRNPDAPDPRHLQTLPETDGEYERWFRFRAGFLTRFGRELRAALQKNGLEHIKIVIWVRPNHCLFDGIDLETWLDEGLCDEVVADVIVAPYFKNRDCYDVRTEWKERVQKKARLIRGIPGFDIEQAREMVPRILEEGYDGICTYESDYTVLENEYRDLYRSLRRHA